MKSKQKESDIQFAILQYLSLKRIFAFRVNNMGVPLPNGGFRPSPNLGVPDIIGIIPQKGKLWGIPLFIEVKSSTGKTSDNQEAFLLRADEAGGLCIVGVKPVPVKPCDDCLRLRNHG
jgi:hypothetical protein